MGQETIDWVAVSQTVILLLFTGFILIGAFTTSTRLVRYWRMGQRPPLILYRDVIARLSLALPFVAIFLVRALRYWGVDTAGFSDNLWWIYGTELPAVFGAGFYVYFELFVLERNGHSRH